MEEIKSMVVRLRSVRRLISAQLRRAMECSAPAGTFVARQIRRMSAKMSDTKLIAAFARNSFLGNLPVKAVLDLVDGAKPVVFNRGDQFIRQGQRGTHFYAIIKGSADIYVTDEGGKKRLIATRSSGDIVGEISVLRGIRCTATVEVVSPTLEALSFSRAGFARLQSQMPDFIAYLSEIAEERVRVLQKRYFGFDAVEIFEAVLKDDAIISLMESIFGYTFKNKGFIRFAFNELRRLQNDPNTDDIKNLFLILRSRFQKDDSLGKTDDDWRNRRFICDITSVGQTNFSGIVVDVGANDNYLGKVLLQEIPGVEKVIGCDIERRPSVIVQKGLEFKTQTDPFSIPIGQQEADTVILRFALHHMTSEEQNRMIREIYRVLKPAGKLVVFEDSFSRGLTPNNPDKYSLHQKMLGLNDPLRIKLLLTAIDVFALVLRDNSMPYTSNYRSVEEWISFFRDNLFQVQNFRYLGYHNGEFVTPNPNAIFVLAKRISYEIFQRLCFWNARSSNSED